MIIVGFKEKPHAIQLIGELEFKIMNQAGEIERLWKQPMNSLIKNFCIMVYNQWAMGSAVFKNTSNADATPGTPQYFDVTGPATNNNYGILVGTGTGAVTITDYALGTKIAHGNAASQLYHQACAIGAVATSGADAYTNITRSFNNNSGGTISVQEICLVMKFSGANTYIMVARDLTGQIDVLNTKTFATQYQFKVTC